MKYVQFIRYLHLLLLFTLSNISLVHAEDSPPTPLAKGVFWKIEKIGVAPSYLLGTIHSEDSRVLNLPDVIKKRFNQAETASFELKMDFNTMMRSLGAMYLEEDKTLESVINNKAEYTELLAQLEKQGMPEVAVKRMKLWAIMLTLSMPRNQSGMFLDLMLYQRAQQQGKTVYGLETVDEQLAVFDTLTVAQQLSLLKDTIKQFNEIPDALERIHELYLNRDLQKMADFYQSYADKSEDIELNKFFMARLIDERNERMVERMLPRLQEGEAFIAVGAMHLPTEKGILALLKKQGYKVSPIY